MAIRYDPASPRACRDDVRRSGTKQDQTITELARARSPRAIEVLVELPDHIVDEVLSKVGPLFE